MLGLQLCTMTSGVWHRFIYPSVSLSSHLHPQSQLAFLVPVSCAHFVFHCVYLIIVLFEKIIPANFPMSFIKAKCDFISSVTNTRYREGEGRLKHDSATLIYIQGLHKWCNNNVRFQNSHQLKTRQLVKKKIHLTKHLLHIRWDSSQEFKKASNPALENKMWQPLISSVDEAQVHDSIRQ